MRTLCSETQFLSDDPESGTESSALSESSSHGTGDSVRDEDEQLNEDVRNTKAKHTALMDQGDNSSHASSRQRKNMLRETRVLVGFSA